MKSSEKQEKQLLDKVLTTLEFENLQKTNDYQNALTKKQTSNYFAEITPARKLS